MPLATAPATAGLTERLAGAGIAVGTRATDRLAAAHDASHYRLVPELLATPSSAEQVAAILAAAAAHGTAVTFRSGGTSLSGQAGTDRVLVDTRHHFRGIRVLDGGARVEAGPGATVRAVNTRLARHGRKLGPDPASEIACTIGGVVANNSSGMACGVEQNTYRTLDSSVLVLPSGTVVDTSAPDADDRLRRDEPELHAGLARLRDRVRGDADAVARIRALFAIKNTMGYGVNALLDHDRPVDILEHLVVGSEGTLAFVASATFRTVPLRTHVATGLLVFRRLADAAAALPGLVADGFAAIELMDATSLRVAQRDPAAPADLAALEVEEHAALLVELQEATVADLDARVAAWSARVDELPLLAPGDLSEEPERRASLWHLRKGLYTLVAGARPPGTTALLEDVAVPVERLDATCTALTRLFEKHDYEDCVIFGHAKDGNIHFMLTERFDDEASVTRYTAFTEEMAALVLAQGGTLKAEHGTGRIMAPFVRRQYGDALYAVMREIKALVDPGRILNPDVVISDDESIHLRHLKVAAPVEEEVDRCVECGYCEPACPSRDLTLTPRERIVLRREMEHARRTGDEALHAQLEREYVYDGVETCAVDGMCQTACPVLINTGDLVRRLRAEQRPAPADAIGRTAAAHWDGATRAGGIALSIADRLPAGLTAAATAVGRAVLGTDVVPSYSGDLPAGGRRRPSVQNADPVAVYFSSCTTTMFGPTDGPGVAASFLKLCDRAGVAVATPDDLPSLCCGTPWKSKGLSAGYELMRDRVTASLRRATRDGELPVVCDASSCTEGLEVLLGAAEEAGITVVDAVAFVGERVLPHLPELARIPSITLHPTCSSTRLGIDGALRRVAEAVTESVVVPDAWGCCGFAGDRGMLHPELTESATRAEADEVRRLGSERHASLNRTCELGMTRATGEDYAHVLELLAQRLPARGVAPA